MSGKVESGRVVDDAYRLPLATLQLTTHLESLAGRPIFLTNHKKGGETMVDERMWKAIPEFVDFLEEEGALCDYVRKHNLNVREEDLLREIREGTPQGIEVYVDLFRQNLLEYHRWRYRKGLE